jgi:hypothetical protein
LTVIAVAAALTAAGCGGDDDNGKDAAGTSATTSPATSSPATGDETMSRTAPESGAPADGESTPAAPAPAPAGSGVPQVSPGRDCLTGGYRSVSFVGKRGLDSPAGSLQVSGRGRGLALEFQGASWRMRGVGRKPMQGKVLGIKGTLKINGSAHGTLTRAPGGRLRFRQSGSTGTVTLTGLGQTFKLPVAAVAPAVVPDGRARITCSGRRLTIDSVSGVLRLTRP